MTVTDDDFHDGAITKIEFKNFLTYDHVVCEPGPKLNVIIGPNGTGKSTIICGICLALGGSPKVLGRSDNIMDFIKHGETNGSVEVSLRDRNAKTAQNGCRKFKVELKHPNKTNHYIDGKKVTATELRETVDRYNIQVSNPCTFLAQDKVKSFSEQGPKVLLQNTEKAGPTELLEKHKELIDFTKSGEKIEQENQKDQERLNVLQKNLNTKKARAENFREKEQLKTKVKLFKKKLAVLRYNHALAEFNSKKTEVREIEREFTEKSSRVGPIRERRDALKSHISKYRKEVEELRNAKRKTQEKIDEINQRPSMNQMMEELSADYRQYENDKKRWEERQKNLIQEKDTFEHSYKSLEQSIKNNYDPNLNSNRIEVEKEYRNVKQRQSTLNDNMEKHRDQMNELERKKSAQIGIEQRKLNHLASQVQKSRIREAWEFYQNNRHRFRCEVYVPFLSVYVFQPQHLKYLNNLVAFKDWSIFIFGYREDEELLMGGNNPYGINSTIVSQHQLQSLANIQPLPDELRSMGFHVFANDLFEAPVPVRAYLNSIYRLDTVPIGSDAVEDRAEDIAETIGRRYKIFFTERSRIHFQSSRYSNASYVKKSALHTKLVLLELHTWKNEDYDAKIRDMEMQIGQMQSEVAQLYSDEKKLQEQRQEIVDKINRQQENANNLARVKNRFERAVHELENHAKIKPDFNKVKAATAEKTKAIKERMLRKMDDLIREKERMRAVLARAISVIFELQRKEKFLHVMEDLIDECRQESQEAEMHLREQRNELEQLKQIVTERTDELKRVVRISTTNQQLMTAEDKIHYKKLKKELEAIQNVEDPDQLKYLIEQEESHLTAAQLDGTQQDVVEYEAMKDEAESLKQKIDRRQKDKENWMERMNQKLKEWRDPLDRLVNSVSSHYSKFFKQIGCAGTVTLEAPENEFEIENYGIKIMVKFRNNVSLRPLDHQVQSGGERSVSTMLYLMALQEQCPVPFRCVDEINQGMDPTNERLVFDMMVKLLSGTGQLAKTQYFLLTPKLLPGLAFNEKVTVLCVHNGPTLKNASHWDVDKFLRSKNLG